MAADRERPGGIVNQLLVIEDDASIRESLVDYFRGRDWLVHACSERAAAEKLLAVGDTKRNEALDVSELAAYTMVANLILNLDETVTKE